MVWADVSTHGKLELRFIEHGSTIISRYYIEHIIEPFIKYDIPRLFLVTHERVWFLIKIVRLVM